MSFRFRLKNLNLDIFLTGFMLPQGIISGGNLAMGLPSKGKQAIHLFTCIQEMCIDFF